MILFYGILSVLGLALPMTQFIPWLMEHGLDIPIFFEEAIQTRIGAFAWLDVIVSAIVLIGFIIHEGRRQKMRHLWIPILGTLSIGVSLGLPLFLLLRELHLKQETKL